MRLPTRTAEGVTALVGLLAPLTKATVVPVYFPGRNSLLFQGISLINRKARVAFLPREVVGTAAGHTALW